MIDKQEKGFKLEGSVEDRPLSEYVEERIESQRQKPRIVIALLSTIAMLLFVWASISQYRIYQNKKLVKEAKEIKSVFGSDLVASMSNSTQIDSLRKLILKLQTENDLLAENYSIPEGVFFEVQLGSFNDFNLDQYLENLAGLRQTKYEGKTKFLLGRFRSFNKAILFESDLKKMGINNAFLVGRIDEKIVPYQDALEANNQNNN